MTMNKIAIDINILLYSVDLFDPAKQEASIQLIAKSSDISSQRVSEFSNVCLRKWKFPKEKVGEIVTAMVGKYEFIPVIRQIIVHAIEIMPKYRLQFFDAIIITVALDEGCEILYSGDMHHNLLVEKSLKIINPFV